MTIKQKQEEINEEMLRRFKFNLNYDPSRPSNYPTLDEHKLERIRESATPQPLEWELADYDAIDGSWCGIENRIFIDEGESYKHENHPLWIYLEFKNIKTKNPHAYYTCFYLPITVEKRPQIIGDIEGMNINPKIIANVKRFISGNVKALKDIADMKDRERDKLVPIFMLKDENVLTESPNFLKKDLALPVNIWIDPGSSPQHSPDRIKFQNNHNDKIEKHNFCTMMLFGNMEIIGDPKDVSTHEINIIRKFCKINRELIVSLYKGGMKKLEFTKGTTKVDPKGNPIQTESPANSTWEIKKGMTMFNISVVVSNSGQYNYLKNNQLLCDCWFDKANPFQQDAGRIAAFARNDDTWYKIDENGGIQTYMKQ